MFVQAFIRYIYFTKKELGILCQKKTDIFFYLSLGTKLLSPYELQDTSGLFSSLISHSKDIISTFSTLLDMFLYFQFTEY